MKANKIITVETEEKFNEIKLRLIKNGSLPVKIPTGSMEPVIKTHSEVTVFPIKDVKSIQPFDIIIFWNGSLLICHYFVTFTREISKKRDYIITKGLSLKYKDSKTNPEHILGIVDKKIPGVLKFRETLRLGLFKITGLRF